MHSASVPYIRYNMMFKCSTQEIIRISENAIAILAAKSFSGALAVVALVAVKIGIA